MDGSAASIRRWSGRAMGMDAVVEADQRLSVVDLPPEKLPLDDGEREALWRVHEHFARRWAVDLCAQLQTGVEVRLVELRTATYAELALASSLPACLATLSAMPLATPALLWMEPMVLYPFFDWLLGGGAEPTPIPARPMTEIETILAERFVRSWCDRYVEVWQHVLSLELRLERFEHNPLRIRPLPPAAPLMLAEWELRLGRARGAISWGIPWTSMLPLAHKLTANAVSDRDPFTRQGSGL